MFPALSATLAGCELGCSRHLMEKVIFGASRVCDVGKVTVGSIMLFLTTAVSTSGCLPFDTNFHSVFIFFWLIPILF